LGLKDSQDVMVLTVNQENVDLKGILDRLVWVYEVSKGHED
jgi:hypothetical protein